MGTQLHAAVDALHEELRPVEERLQSHPYLEAVEDGRITESGLRAFAAEQHAIISSDRRSLGHLAARFPDDPAGSFFLDMAGGEGQALARLAGFERAVGLNADARRAYEPKAGCQAYPAFVAWLALNGGRADVGLAFLVNLVAWGESCARIAAALREHHRLGDEEVSFFDFFAVPPPRFEERALEVAAAGLAAGEELDRAVRAARLLQAYELLYWDTLAQGL